jgi:hypothetical protein
MVFLSRFQNVHRFRIVVITENLRARRQMSEQKVSFHISIFTSSSSSSSSSSPSSSSPHVPYTVAPALRVVSRAQSFPSRAPRLSAF